MKKEQPESLIEKISGIVIIILIILGLMIAFKKEDEKTRKAIDKMHYCQMHKLSPECGGMLR